MAVLIGFSIGAITSFFDLGWFCMEQKQLRFNPKGAILNIVLIVLVNIIWYNIKD